jgi:hypothetical protein
VNSKDNVAKRAHRSQKREMRAKQEGMTRNPTEKEVLNCTKPHWSREGAVGDQRL